MITTEAWVLPEGPIGRDAGPGELALETIQIPDCTESEALVEPLYGSWEANMSHAISRSPVDICRQRGEKWVIVGNSGVVRVLRPAASDRRLKEGDACLVMGIGKPDDFGYAERIYAYDMRKSYGLLTRRTKIGAAQLVPISDEGKYPLQRWSQCARYYSAWDNWKVAYGCWRTQMRDEDPADHLVFGWGGGVVVAELELARRSGFRVAMTVGSGQRAEFVSGLGITPVDRNLVRDSERTFFETIGRLSDGRGAAIFLDNIGGSLYPIVLRSLARQGVIATCGWKEGMKLNVTRASECIGRRLHVHTHCWNQADYPRVRDYQQDTGWLPEIDAASVYSFSDIPRLAGKYASGEERGYFPTYKVG